MTKTEIRRYYAKHLITLAKAQEEDNRKGGRYHG